MFENITVPKIEIGINQWTGVRIRSGDGKIFPKLIKTIVEILRIWEFSQNHTETRIKIMSKNLTAHCVRLSHFLEKYDFMQYSAWGLRQDYGKVL